MQYQQMFADPSAVPVLRESPNPATNSGLAEEDINRLLNACRTGRGNAGLLYEALVYAKPEDLGGNIIQEFFTRCHESQDLILSHIAWATAEAERSRQTTWSSMLTIEERLLKEFLAANEELVEALRMYDDSERVASEAEIQEQLLEPRTEDFTATHNESALVSRIFLVGDPGHSGLVSASAAVKILAGSGLPTSTLAKVWDIADENKKGGLDRRGVGIAVRLIGYAQEGTPVNKALCCKPGRLAHIDALPHPGPNPSTAELPPLTDQDKAKFFRLFMAYGSKDGSLSGPQARDILLMSKLAPTMLSKIWDLADARHRGFLDQGDFVVAMYLVQAVMKGKLTEVPASLPAYFYENAAAMPSSSFSVQRTSGPSTSSCGLPVSQNATQSRAELYSPILQWGITPALKAKSDQIFETLDPQKKGRVAGDAAGTFLSRSGLPVDVLGRIWELSDTGMHGFLTRDEFAVALYLVQLKRSGKELPLSLPQSLIPPASELHEIRSPAQSLHAADSLTNRGSLEFPTSLVPRSILPSAVASSSGLHLSINPSLLPPSSPRHVSASQGTSPSPPVVRQVTNGLGSVFRTPPTSPSLAGLHTRSFSMQQTSEFPNGRPFRLDIPQTDRARYDAFFDTLDPWRKEYIEDDVAGPFFEKSKLPAGVMARIWDLADINGDGRLTRHEFAVAMHLVREKLRGKELPMLLPESLRSSSPADPGPPPLPPRRRPPEVTRGDTPPPPYSP